ncbi:hypothetical protein WL555_00190 [Staphylococcus warneri]|jgi:hypothetical protein|uniref:Uncharacterized protein n=2 Tax=Staphylococcus warneri TaxID=1292 RepID=A0A2T4Q0B6_STAWA|nr:MULTISPECIES: hypothetical protein [Staphylococcus]AXV43158.1 hypothetical protein Ssp1_21480 [Staphylococcus sp. M0911]EEQ79195.1 hypothetical protein STAWA0001_0538 [Staphylococcus warneri L37603]MBJ7886945.1 hypothetical protein [Bacillaceae bacterium HSR45]OLS07019.1 hypothetical protein AUK68_05820 [Staphylococcus epidermidis]PAK73145.1 hypothetical protein B8W95_04290 [Staphylococcus pasteuri]SKR54282.1 Uncharacterised protein [Mycobacteroides abscessus subsp. abscessus]HBY82510.1 h
MNNQKPLQTYKSKQTTVIITSIIFMLFIISDIRTILSKDEWLPLALAGGSLIIFIVFLMINIKSFIHNYKRRPY